MPEKSDNPKNFWQELKRRKVFRVLAIYAGIAYIIIEVVNNLVDPLHLPVWVATLIILLLAIGFPIAAIFAWIFDFTTEGIVRTVPVEETEQKKPLVKPARKSRLKASDFVIGALIVIVAVLVWPKIFNRNSLESLSSSNGRISVAVMPFQNMTSDTTWDVWQSGIQNELIASLTNSEELKVKQPATLNSIMRSRGITNYASIAPSVASTISQKLDASVLVYGSINQAGNIVRVNTQLINPKNEEVIKSFQIESSDGEDMIFSVIDSLSAQVKDFLIISKLKQESSVVKRYTLPTSSPDAYRYFMYGEKAFYNMDYTTAIDYYLQAIAIDSSFYYATIKLSVVYYNLRQYDQAKEWCLKVYHKRNEMDIGKNIHLSWLHALYFETPNEEIKYCNQLLELDDQNPLIYYELGRIYVALAQYDKAITVMRKALDIYKTWESKPPWANDYIMLGYSYHETGQYRKEKKLYNKAEQDFPDIYSISQRQAILSLTGKDTIAAKEYIDKCISIAKDFSVSDVDIKFGLAYTYTEGGYLDKAEGCYREAISMEPENPSCLNNLGWFLIHEDRNIDEGVELMDKALKIRPNSYLYLENKGEGLYKQGKYNEALDLLEKSWELRPVYNHSSYLLLEKVKKAVAEQLNN